MFAAPRGLRLVSLVASTLVASACSAPAAEVPVPVALPLPPIAAPAESAAPAAKSVEEPIDPRDEELEVTGRMVTVGVVTDRVKQQIEALPDHASMVLRLRGHVTSAKLATVRKLPWLRELMLPTGVISLAPLDGSPALVDLFAPGLEVTSLEPLARLPRLTQLAIFGSDRITDFSALSRLSNLERLDVSHTLLSSFAPLAKLPLRVLQASGVRASDVEVIARIVTLRELLLQESPAEDFSALAALRELEFIALDRTRIQDISFAADLPRLRTLHLDGCKRLSDLRPAGRVSALRRLAVAGTAARDLGPLRAHPTLDTLDLSETEVIDLGPLQSLPALHTLSARSTPLTDLRPLAGGKVRWLDLGRSKVRDLRPLASAAKLEHLDISGTAVTDLSPLAQSKALRTLIVSPSVAVEKLDKLRRALPDLKITVRH